MKTPEARFHKIEVQRAWGRGFVIGLWFGLLAGVPACIIGFMAFP